MDKISIVTISYNCAKSIERTILSVINLDYVNKEYIIIDGASTDNTLSIIEKYKDKIDVFVSEPDKGIYDAMNKGILKATGEWIIFMNAGDCFHSKTAASELMTKVENDTIIAHGDIIRVFSHYRYRVPQCQIEEMKTRMAVKHQATFTRVSYHKLNLFDVSFRSSGDYDFFYKAYFRDNVKFQHIPVVVADFDSYTGISNINFRKSFREDLRIWKKENDLFFRFQQELMFFRWDILAWFKRHFMSDEQILQREINKIQSMGIVEYEIKEAE